MDGRPITISMTSMTCHGWGSIQELNWRSNDYFLWHVLILSYARRRTGKQNISLTLSVNQLESESTRNFGSISTLPYSGEMYLLLVRRCKAYIWQKLLFQEHEFLVLQRLQNSWKNRVEGQKFNSRTDKIILSNVYLKSGHSFCSFRSLYVPSFSFDPLFSFDGAFY